MSSIEKTAYPRFPKRKKIRPDELSRSYSLRQDEVTMINLAANTDKSRFNMAIQLKTFQRLGYFVEANKIPSEIIVHIRQSLKYHYRLTPGYGNNTQLPPTEVGGLAQSGQTTEVVKPPRLNAHESKHLRSKSPSEDGGFYQMY